MGVLFLATLQKIRVVVCTCVLLKHTAWGVQPPCVLGWVKPPLLCLFGMFCVFPTRGRGASLGVCVVCAHSGTFNLLSSCGLQQRVTTADTWQLPM